MFKFRSLLILLLSLMLSGKLSAQYLRGIVGTDIPMQYLIGVNYQQGNFASAEMSIGYVGIPYNGDLYKVIKVPEKHEARKQYLIETTDDGWVWGGGINGHFKKWYGGVFFQRLELHASATYKYILGSDLFQEELNADQKVLLNTFLEEGADLGVFKDELDLGDVMRLNMVSWQAGIKVGRRFFFKNPRWEFRAEFAFSKNMSAIVTSDYDEALFDNVKRQYKLIKSLPAEDLKKIEDYLGYPLNVDQDLDKLLDFETRQDDMEDWFHKYGYIPTLNFRLSYLIFVPEKVKKAQQQKVSNIDDGVKHVKIKAD